MPSRWGPVGSHLLTAASLVRCSEFNSESSLNLRISSHFLSAAMLDCKRSDRGELIYFILRCASFFLTQSSHEFRLRGVSGRARGLPWGFNRQNGIVAREWPVFA